MSEEDKTAKDHQVAKKPALPKPEGLPTLEERLEVIKKLAEKLQVTIPEKYKGDLHFWYLVLREYWFQRRALPQNFGPVNDQNLLKMRHHAINMAVNAAGRFAELEKEAAVDGLTGAFNRRALDKYLLDLLSHRRTGVTDAVIMFDIDYLKEINDRYGHPIGDAVLKALTELIQKNIRGIDFFARYGGEEFFLVMPEINTEEPNWQEKFLQRIDDLREAIEDQVAARVRESNPGLTIGNPITASFGVMFIDDQLVCVDEKEVSEKVYSVVDKFLYDAKNNGRNCVVGPNGVFKSRPLPLTDQQTE
ncbi:MAG: GGDEF domain-containing protein [Microgenomates group bacterium]|nr:GGDEF domain-containing protein [Microgenomates group bacterium]